MVYFGYATYMSQKYEIYDYSIILQKQKFKDDVRMDDGRFFICRPPTADC